MDRREFLKMLGLGAAVSVTPRVFFGPQFGVVYRSPWMYAQYDPGPRGHSIVRVTYDDTEGHHVVERRCFPGAMENGDVLRIARIPKGAIIQECSVRLREFDYGNVIGVQFDEELASVIRRAAIIPAP